MYACRPLRGRAAATGADPDSSGASTGPSGPSKQVFPSSGGADRVLARMLAGRGRGAVWGSQEGSAKCLPSFQGLLVQGLEVRPANAASNQAWPELLQRRLLQEGKARRRLQTHSRFYIKQPRATRGDEAPATWLVQTDMCCTLNLIHITTKYSNNIYDDYTLKL